MDQLIGHGKRKIPIDAVYKCFKADFEHLFRSICFVVRCILLYTFGLISFTVPRFEILDQIDQPQQVSESGKRSPPGVDDERVDVTGVGPTRREKGRLPIFGIIKNSPLTPTTPAINKLILPSAPGMKWVGYPKILFCILRIRCSSRPMPRVRWNAVFTASNKVLKAL
jgi:hypothetical protein